MKSIQSGSASNAPCSDGGSEVVRSGSKSPRASSHSSAPSVSARKSRPGGFVSRQVAASLSTHGLAAASGDARRTRLSGRAERALDLPLRSPAGARFVWSRKTRGGHQCHHLYDGRAIRLSVRWSWAASALSAAWL